MFNKMSHHISYLKKFRKQSHLSQDDISYLLGINNKSLLSRYENGDRYPHVEHLLIFHFIYGRQIEELYKPFLKTTRKTFLKRLRKLIKREEKKGGSSKIQRRKKYLNSILSSLTNS